MRSPSAYKTSLMIICMFFKLFKCTLEVPMDVLVGGNFPVHFIMDEDGQKAFQLYRFLYRLLCYPNLRRILGRKNCVVIRLFLRNKLVYDVNFRSYADFRLEYHAMLKATRW